MKEIQANELGATLKGETPVVVDFFGDQCAPCKALTPVLEEVGNELAEEVRIVKLNVAGDNFATASQFGVRSVPTLILFKGGSVVAKRMGTGSKQDILKWIGENS